MIAKAKAVPAQQSGADELDIEGAQDSSELSSVGRENSNYISEQLRAMTARRAGRVNAASISSDEEEELHRRRRDLLAKQYTDGLSSADERKLALVRWSLDRIDDARNGEILDALESAVLRYEAAREEIRSLMSQIDQVMKRQRRR